MARNLDYYYGDILSKLGCGLLGGSMSAVIVTQTISQVPLIALFIASIFIIGGVNFMRKNE